METRKLSGSERANPDSRRYPAMERTCQAALASHPKGMGLPVHSFVALHPAGTMSRPSLTRSLDPCSVRSLAMRAAALGFSDLGRIEQRCDNRRGSDSDSDTCLDQLGPPFFVSSFLAHAILSFASRLRTYALRRTKGSTA